MRLNILSILLLISACGIHEEESSKRTSPDSASTQSVPAATPQPEPTTPAVVPQPVKNLTSNDILGTWVSSCLVGYGNSTKHTYTIAPGSMTHRYDTYSDTSCMTTKWSRIRNLSFVDPLMASTLKPDILEFYFQVLGASWAYFNASDVTTANASLTCGEFTSYTIGQFNGTPNCTNSTWTKMRIRVDGNKVYASEIFSSETEISSVPLTKQ